MTDKNHPFSALHIPEEVRDFAERSVTQASKAFDGFLHNAETQIKRQQDQGQAFQQHWQEGMTQALSMAHDHMGATFTHMRQLLKAETPQDFFALQQAFFQAQADLLKQHMQAAIRPTKPETPSETS